MKELGIYIHIPFCIQKCYYCDFISFANKLEYQKKYIDNLKYEIQAQKNILEKSHITTIYIGGGTPSIIDSKYIVEVLNEIKKCMNVEDYRNAEITIEVNPGAVDIEKLKDYKNAGINRISIGLQSTQDRILKKIGRIHTWEDFNKTYQDVIDVGFENINVDLMIGLPELTINDIKESLDKVIKLSPKHISVYSLIVEENTKMEEFIESGKYILPDEEQERMEYRYVKDYLELNDYEHYEISNFSKKNYHSKHNENCWKQKEYIGFGIAAHSYIDGIRFSNTENLNNYIQFSEEDFSRFNIENLEEMVKLLQEKNHKENENSNYELDEEFPISFGIRKVHEIQNLDSQKKEYMLLGLRMLDGVLISEFKMKFGENPLYLFRKELAKLVDENLVKVDLDNIKLTRKGLDLANLVWEEFV